MPRATLTRMPPAAKVGLVVLAAVQLAYIGELVFHVVPTSASTLFQKFATNIVFIGAALVCAARGLAWREERAAWLWFSAGLMCWGLGDLYFTLALWDLEEIPFPSLADVGYLAFYVPVYAALVLLFRSRVHGAGAGLWADGVVGALAVSAIGAAIVFDAVVAGTGGSTATVATNLAYPLADLLVLSLVVAVMAMTSWRLSTAWALIAGGLAVFAVTDSLYLWASAVGSYDPGGKVFDAGWPLGALLVAIAAWLPARRVEAARAWAETWWTIALPIVFGLLSVGLLVFDHFERANVLAVGLAAASLVAVLVRLVLFFRDNVRMLRKSLSEATTDLLTGLPNRRKLMADLERKLLQASEDDPLALILLDLDGFKLYNDNFGHPAGDELLVRLGRSLASACGQSAVPYRMGGDEFCVLSNVEGRSAYDLASSAARALDEEGEGFRVSASYGTVLMPNETADVGEALRLVDARMYVQKQSGRASASHQSTNVLLQAIMECERELGLHLNAVTELAEATGRRMGLPEDELERARLTASLHDVGKVAIPDAILAKAEPLDETEWQFIQRHTLIGQRILAAAPALVDVAQLVRWTHERFDGRGYPDGLEGESIPLASRIVAVCDAFEAMISKRTYREAMSVGDALAELRRCSGTQFDPAVVEAFCGEVAARGKRARPLVGISASSRR